MIRGRRTTPLEEALGACRGVQVACKFHITSLRARTLRRGAKASASRSRRAAPRAGSRLGARLDEPERAPSPGCAARGPQPLLLRLLRLLLRLLRLLLLVSLLLLLLLALIAAAPARLGHGGGPRQRPCLTPGATPARPLAAGRGSALQPRSGAQIDWSAANSSGPSLLLDGRPAARTPRRAHRPETRNQPRGGSRDTGLLAEALARPGLKRLAFFFGAPAAPEE